MLQGCGPGLALCVSMFFHFSALSQMIGAPDREWCCNIVFNTELLLQVNDALYGKDFIFNF